MLRILNLSVSRLEGYCLCGRKADLQNVEVIGEIYTINKTVIDHLLSPE